MPTMIKQDDGSEVEYFSAEEVAAKAAEESKAAAEKAAAETAERVKAELAGAGIKSGDRQPFAGGQMESVPVLPFLLHL